MLSYHFTTLEVVVVAPPSRMILDVAASRFKAH